MPGEHPPDQRSVEVPLHRLPRWLDGFAQRHGDWSARTEPPGWRLTTADGTAALVNAPEWWGLGRADVDPGGSAAAAGLGPLDPPALAALRPVFGVLLLRRAGYAVGLFHGRELVARKVGSRHVHGRTAAGGWSQQRYARRRANQADEITEAAVAAAARVLAVDQAAADQTAADQTAADPGAGPPEFLVTGGDRPLLASALAGLPAQLRALPVAAHLAVGTPDARVLAGVPDRVLSVRIDLGGTARRD